MEEKEDLALLIEQLEPIHRKFTEWLAKRQPFHKPDIDDRNKLAEIACITEAMNNEALLLLCENRETKKRKLDDDYEDGLSHFYTWRNRVPGEPLDLVDTRLWNAWCPLETCKVCKKGPFSSAYEVNLQWGDSDSYEYISEMCIDCICKLNTLYIRNKSPKFFLNGL